MLHHESSWQRDRCEEEKQISNFKAFSEKKERGFPIDWELKIGSCMI
jgi:hypothetical protein